MDNQISLMTYIHLLSSQQMGPGPDLHMLLAECPLCAAYIWHLVTLLTISLLHAEAQPDVVGLLDYAVRQVAMLDL